MTGPGSRKFRHENPFRIPFCSGNDRRNESGSKLNSEKKNFDSPEWRRSRGAESKKKHLASGPPANKLLTIGMYQDAEQGPRILRNHR